MFDLLRFENSEIREVKCFERFADLMKIEVIEIKHLEFESLEDENMQ
jgi:hypothetical protein